MTRFIICPSQLSSSCPVISLAGLTKTQQQAFSSKKLCALFPLLEAGQVASPTYKAVVGVVQTATLRPVVQGFALTRILHLVNKPSACSSCNKATAEGMLCRKPAVLSCVRCNADSSAVACGTKCGSALQHQIACSSQQPLCSYVNASTVVRDLLSCLWCNADSSAVACGTWGVSGSPAAPH